MPREAQDDPKDGKNNPKGTPKTPHREAQDALEDSLEHPWEALGRPGASDPKTEEGIRVFRLKNGPDFRGPGQEFSMIFVINFRLEFCLIFNTVLAA